MQHSKRKVSTFLRKEPFLQLVCSDLKTQFTLVEFRVCVMPNITLTEKKHRTNSIELDQLYSKWSRTPDNFMQGKRKTGLKMSAENRLTAVWLWDGKSCFMMNLC